MTPCKSGLCGGLTVGETVCLVQSRANVVKVQPEWKHQSLWRLEPEVISFRQGSSRTRKQCKSFHLSVAAAAAATKGAQNVDLPLVLPKNKKKPKAKASQVTKKTWRKGRPLEPILRAPQNGLLVRHYIPIAHDVMEAKAIVIKGIDLLLKAVPVVTCRSCPEVHISSVGHNLQTCAGPRNDGRHSFHDWVEASMDDILVPVPAYHLTDRMALPIAHEERFDMDRISAIEELCIQAGVDVPEYPTKRYLESIQSPNREKVGDASWMGDEFSFFLANGTYKPFEFPQQKQLEETSSTEEEDDQQGEIEAVEGQNSRIEPLVEPGNNSFAEVKSIPLIDVSSEDDLQTVAQKTLDAWERMRAGAKKLKSKYRVLACGYCPEVHVGPKGHRGRVCGAFKHQWRNGRHGWQTASIDELIPPQYVWHVRDRHGPPLEHALKRFYGKAPAVVELCVQAGVPVPDIHKPLMRLDIAIPTLDELENVI